MMNILISEHFFLIVTFRFQLFLLYLFDKSIIWNESFWIADDEKYAIDPPR